MKNKIWVWVQISLIFVGCGLSNPNQIKDVIAQNRKKWERQKNSPLSDYTEVELLLSTHNA